LFARIVPQALSDAVFFLGQEEENLMKPAFISLILALAVSAVVFMPVANSMHSATKLNSTRISDCAFQSKASTFKSSQVLTTDTLQDLNGSYQRWKDIAENAYTTPYQTNYNYSQANVSVIYEQTGSSFSGSFDATGLKPNFAYQLKLQGKPIEDPVSDQRLKDIGRSYDIAPNLTGGYVIFDFILTDRNGEVHHNFSLANSYHVLWKTSQRTPQPNDSAIKWQNVEGGPEDLPHAYASNVGPTSIGIYAEWEKGIPGNVNLPNGTYDVKFIITEESFHSQKGDTLGGYWSTVMGCDVAFTIFNAVHDVGITNVAASKTVVGKGYSMSVNFTVENQGDYFEDINMSMFANSSQIGNQILDSIDPHEAITGGFVWNTTDVSNGSYVVTVGVGLVPGETDFADNTMTVNVVVSFPGDISGDGSVDIYDAIILASAFNSVSGGSNWNANSDINNDDVVDVYDAIIVAANFH